MEKKDFILDESIDAISKAKKRRAEILQDANFYGAMDGSSKFVKGDAVAGIIITLINIIGGFLIGAFQHNMEFGASLEAFTMLTIGDGLVSQLPALIISGGSFVKSITVDGSTLIIPPSTTSATSFR